MFPPVAVRACRAMSVFPGFEKYGSNMADAMVFSPDGSMLYIASGDEVIATSSSGESSPAWFQDMSAGSLCDIAVSPDGVSVRFKVIMCSNNILSRSNHLTEKTRVFLQGNLLATLNFVQRESLSPKPAQQGASSHVMRCSDDVRSTIVEPHGERSPLEVVPHQRDRHVGRPIQEIIAESFAARRTGLCDKLRQHGQTSEARRGERRRGFHRRPVQFIATRRRGQRIYLRQQS